MLNFDRFQIVFDKLIAQNNALKNIDTLSQRSIDHIIDNAKKKSEDLFPKGIQEKTLQMIMDCLAESGWMIGEMNYETGGRPCMRYKVD